MNFNTYGSYYGKFHKSSISAVKQNIIIFEMASAPYETWIVGRMYPPENVSIDSTKPLLLALKTFFKSDVPASVVCSRKYLWTICLGNERIIFPINKDVRNVNRLQLYATPYYVSNPEIVSQYLQATIRPAYENVFFYKNTVLYLDNEDLPYPGGCYFNKCLPTKFYRICFLSDEPMDYVIDLATEWQARRDVMMIPYMTREVKANPKFLNVVPVNESGFLDANILSTGIIHKTLSSRKPELLIQDVLTSYYKNIARRAHDGPLDFSYLGVFIEWPFLLTFEGARHSESKEQIKHFASFSINGNNPTRILYVCRPYDRYIEYNHVPATIWSPISFVLSTLLTDTNIKKVAIDTVVIGVVYRETFFCFSQPLLEGAPTPLPLLNAEYILSTATIELNEDINIRVIETFKCNNDYSLRRVSLRGLAQDCWCLTKSSNTDPYPRNIRLPEMVKMWLNFFMEVGNDTFDVDVTAVRIAIMLSKHKICYNLNEVEKSKDAIVLSDNEVNFYFTEQIVGFINEARLTKQDTVEGWRCRIS